MTVGGAGFQNLRANPSRVALGRAVISWCGECGVDAVIFPAGFLRAPWQDTVAAKTEAGPLVEQAEESSVALVVGVDLCSQSQMDKHEEKLIRNGQLPMGVVAWWPAYRSFQRPFTLRPG